MRSILVWFALWGSSLTALQSEAILKKYVQEGETALAEGRYQDAEKAYEKLRDLVPGTAEVNAKLGIIYFQERKFDRAVSSLRQALKLKPALPNADVLLAMSLSELGRYREALPGLEKGFRHSSDTALKRMAGLQLQRAYTGLREDGKAAEVALELTRLFPKDPEVLYHAGRLIGNYAYLTMRSLSEVAPDSVWRHLAAGDAYESQGNYDLAITEYKAVLASDPAHLGIHFRMGRVLLLRDQQSGSRAAAIAEFEQELHLDPTNANAAYELGEIYRKSGQFDRARGYFETAIAHYPDFQEAQVGLGRAWIALGKPALALSHLRKAVALDPEDEVPYYSLAQVYKALGDGAAQEKALAEFRRLRNRRSDRQMKTVFTNPEVTRQKLDSDARP